MKWKGTYRKTGCLLSAFLLVNILVKLFFFEIYHVGGHSMRETLLDGDYVLVSKSSYGLRLPRTVLEIPWVNQLFYYTLPENWLEELVPPRGTAWKCVGYQPPRPGDIITFHLPFHPRIVNIKRVQDTCIRWGWIDLFPYGRFLELGRLGTFFAGRYPPDTLFDPQRR